MNEHPDNRDKDPKRISDILHDMGLEGKKSELLKSLQFADTLVRYLHGYHIRMSKLDPLYVQAAELIASFDGYYANERKLLINHIHAPHISKQRKWDGYSHIQTIQDNLDGFEERYRAILTPLRSVTETFARSQDKEEQTEKIDSFSALFMEIYIDISEIQETYDSLAEMM